MKKAPDVSASAVRLAKVQNSGVESIRCGLRGESKPPWTKRTGDRPPWRSRYRKANLGFIPTSGASMKTDVQRE
jgi:hypothetical protein